MPDASADSTAEALLQVRHISIAYEGQPLLRDISFDVAPGEILCLLGPSGTGKTTLLRIIAGLETPEAGTVRFDGNDLRAVPPHQRGFGFMFQDLALFPHRNVFDNVAFGLRMQHTPAPERTARVNEMLDLVGLEAPRFRHRDVNQLSGGEQQRVALARTLAPRPRLVMFDEPLGALDRILREELVREVRTLLKRLQMTALYVTHDQDEAFAMADRLALMHAGRLAQLGTPVELYRQPANAFVARFMGLTNLVEIERLEWEPRAGGSLCGRARTALATFVIESPLPVPADARTVLLRPRAVSRIAASSERRENVVRGRIAETQLRGGHPQLLVETNAGVLVFEWEGPVPQEETVALELDPGEISFLPDEGEPQESKTGPAA